MFAQSAPEARHVRVEVPCGAVRVADFLMKQIPWYDQSWPSGECEKQPKGGAFEGDVLAVESRGASRNIEQDWPHG